MMHIFVFSVDYKKLCSVVFLQVKGFITSFLDASGHFQIVPEVDSNPVNKIWD